MRVTKPLDLPQVIFELFSCYFSHIENGSLRAGMGDGKTPLELTDRSSIQGKKPQP